MIQWRKLTEKVIDVIDNYLMENHLVLQRISEKFILGKEINKKLSIS